MRWRRETFSLALSDIKNQHMILKNGDRQHDGIHKLVLIGGTQNAVQQDFWWSPLLRFSGWFLMFVCLNKIFFFFFKCPDLMLFKHRTTEIQTKCCQNKQHHLILLFIGLSSSNLTITATKKSFIWKVKGKVPNYSKHWPPQWQPKSRLFSRSDSACQHQVSPVLVAWKHEPPNTMPASPPCNQPKHDFVNYIFGLCFLVAKYWPGMHNIMFIVCCFS